MPSVKVQPIEREGGSLGLISARYPQELGQAPWEKWILFEVRTGRHIARDGFVAESEATPDRTIASVALYLPIDALKSTMSMSYKNFSMGAVVGTAIENMFQTQTQKPQVGVKSIGGSMITELLAKNIGTVKETAISAVKTLGALKATAILEATSIAQADSQNTLEALIGGAVNPRTDSVFESVDYRTHEFSFSLIPRTADEAREIDTILNILHFYSLPDYGPRSTGQYFIGYPYEFVITLFTQVTGGGHHINTIERSVLTNMSVDHAGGDRVAFVDDRGGKEYFPAATKMSLLFKETRLLGRDRGRDGKPTDLKDPRAGQPLTVISEAKRVPTSGPESPLEKENKLRASFGLPPQDR